MKPYIVRMIEDQRYLEDKITKGRRAVNDESIDMTEYERLLLSKQMSFYEQASATLILRIKIAKEKEGED